MNRKRIFGILLCVVGLVLIGVSVYMKSRIEEGKAQISSAQEKVNQGDAIFSVHPSTKPIGKLFTGAAQSKINQGKEDVAHYEQLATWFQIGGIILVVIGIGLVFLSRKK